MAAGTRATMEFIFKNFTFFLTFLFTDSRNCEAHGLVVRLVAAFQPEENRFRRFNQTETKESDRADAKDVSLAWFKI
jgi:hypothetical protein